MLNLKELGKFTEFWEYFEQISKIPRCSEHEENIRIFIKQEAEKLGFISQVDEAGNIVVRIPSRSPQTSRGVLQCHMDMVCEKNQLISHDFAKDPLVLKIEKIDDDNWLTAEGTTLGADNGVGICYLLTLLKKIQRGDLNFDSLALDLLFTVDEEQGLRGAFKIDDNFIDGRFLINLDSEEDDTVTIGCAGGKVTFYYIKVKKIIINQIDEKLIPVKISISGLRGGHSGVDIHLGRGNALKILGEILWKLNNKYQIHICSIEGGNRTNAIPRVASTIFYIENKNFFEIDSYSPFSMHPRIKGLVFASNNLGTISTRIDDIEIKLSQRSLNKYFKTVIWEKTKIILDLSDLDVKFSIDSEYPGWNPNFQSNLLSKCKETYTEMFNEDLKIKAIHAGLECGILKEKFPQMEMISIGPTIEGAHSPDERLLIKSVEKVWNILTKLLTKLR